MSKLIVNEIEKYDAGQLTITTGTNVSVGSNLTVGGTISGTLSTAAQPNITSVGTLSSLAVSGVSTLTTSTNKRILVKDAAHNTLGDLTTAITFSRPDGVNDLSAVFAGGSSGALCVSARAGLNFLTGGTGDYTFTETRMTIAEGGNVGIGTSSPGAPLEVSAPASLVVVNSTTGTQYNGVELKNTGGSFYIGQDNSTGTFYGSGTAYAGALYQSGNNPLAIFTGATERARFTSTGLSFPNGNGIDFSASAGGGATSSLLDDYEEGTWTMGISFGGASAGITYSANTGTYTKIGNQVTVRGYLALSNKGSSTGDALITGLPFLTPTVTSAFSACSIFFAQVSFANQLLAINQINTTNIQLFQSTEGAIISRLNNSNFANNSEIIVSLSYIVA